MKLAKRNLCSKEGSNAIVAALYLLIFLVEKYIASTLRIENEEVSTPLLQHLSGLLLAFEGIMSLWAPRYTTRDISTIPPPGVNEDHKYIYEENTDVAN